jgi:hypothetical protein
VLTRKLIQLNHLPVTRSICLKVALVALNTPRNRFRRQDYSQWYSLHLVAPIPIILLGRLPLLVSRRLLPLLVDRHYIKLPFNCRMVAAVSCLRAAARAGAYLAASFFS